MTAQSELGWAVVGTGQVSRLIASDLALIPGARRFAVCSRDAARAAELSDEFGFERAYDDFNAMLDEPEVDMVYIATPHSTHATLAITALQRGKHVLIEKPIAANAVEAEQIVAAAYDSGRFAMEAMWMRFHPAYRAMLDAIAAGSIGEVRSVRASFGLPFDKPDSERWSAERSSSALLDQGIYPVTLAVDVLGRPGAITATGRIRPDGVDLAEHITLEYDNHRFAQLGASMVEYLEPNASINGTDGWITVPAPFWAAASFETRSGSIPDALSSPEVTSFEKRGFGYVPMLAAVGEAIETGLTQHPTHPLADSLETLGILDLIRHAMTG
ncbi:Gfo/Idh/MocA family protein [Leifsonia poae]|uniref:Oxidoreductase n=1 Tax=Leifsonia poae TaxID=110933 RepID=A0A9W6M023_9MICO|nr:Gfo/Idh/MocA family oxidoreductase [Leifsonia poae]GLJ76214.1 putative oxidoreductase [Leifsonia poae]